MYNGKYICNHLKALRRNIAWENGIRLDMPECTYKGKCSGTCPRCEAELRYLEQQLAQRSKLGKAAVVAGMAITLATCQSAMAQENEPQRMFAEEQTVSAAVSLKGRITDTNTGEPLIGCRIVLGKAGYQMGSAITDYDGNYTIKRVPEGIYDVRVSYLGFEKFEDTVKLTKDALNVYNPRLMALTAADDKERVLSEWLPYRKPGNNTAMEDAVWYESRTMEMPPFVTGEVPVELRGD